MLHTGGPQGRVTHTGRQDTRPRRDWGWRSRLAGLLGVCVVLGLGMAPAQGASTLAYITNQGSPNISVIDTATHTVIATVPVGASPQGIAVHPAGTRVYVVLANERIAVLDTATHTVSTAVWIGGCLTGVAINPAGTRVYVAEECNHRVAVLDTATNTVIATVPVGTQPEGLAMHPAGTQVYAANGDGTVSVIDTATHTLSATVRVGSCCLRGLGVHPAGTRVYVGGSPLAVIDTASNTVIATVPVCCGTFGVAVHPAGTRVYAANDASDSVVVVDTATAEMDPDHAVIATVPVGSGPKGIAVTPAGTRVYVANERSNTVSVLNTATNQVIATVPVGDKPWAYGQFIAVVPQPPPTLNLVLTGCTTCRPGDRFIVQARLTNPGTSAVRVEAKAGVRLPDGTPHHLLLDTHLEVPLEAGADMLVTAFDIPVPSGLPRGTYTFEGALLELQLGVTMARSARFFEVVP